MKLLIALFGILLLSFPSQAQNTTQNIYNGIEETLKVRLEGVETKDLEVTITQGLGRITATDVAGEYKILVGKQAIGQRLVIQARNIKGPEQKNYSYDVLRRPYPRVMLGNLKNEGVMKAKEMNFQRGLFVLFGVGELDQKRLCNIEQFTMYYKAKDQAPIEIVQQGATFTGPALLLIKSAKPGDLITFDGVKVKASFCDDCIPTLNKLSFLLI